MALLPISVPVFNSLGGAATTTVEFQIMALPSGNYFDFGSQYGGSGDNTFKSFGSAASPRITLGLLNSTNQEGYYGILLSGSQVPLDLEDFPNGDYLLTARAIAILPRGRYATQIGILNGRLAETIATLITGDGATLVTVVVKEINAAGAPIPNVTVVIRTTAGVLVATGLSDVNGEAIFNLDPGQYLVYLNRIGSADVYTNPYTVDVGTTNLRVELYGAAGGPDVPTPPGTTRVYGYVSELGITPREGIEVRAWVTYPDEAYTEAGVIVTGSKISTLTNADGYFHFDLIPQQYLTPAGIIYRFEIHESDYLVDVAASALDVGGELSLAELGAH